METRGIRKNFLEYSRSWRETKGESSQMTRKILELAVPYLSDDYITARGKKDDILKMFKDFELKVNKNALNHAITQIRIAYLFYMGSPQERERLQAEIQGVSQRTRGLKCLLKDNILTLDDLEREAKAQVNLEPPIIVPNPKNAEMKVADKQQKESEPTPTEQMPPSPSILQDLFTRLINDVTELGAVLIATEEELQNLLNESAQIHERIAQEHLVKAGAQFEREQDHLSALEKIVSAFPQIPQLFEMKEKIRAVIKPVVKQDYLVPEDFPRFMRSEGNARMQYKESFLDDFYDLPRIEQLAVVEALKKLSQYGRTHPSLQTKMLAKDVIGNLGPALRGTPVGALYSRASREIRFTWIKEGMNAIFIRAGRRSATGFSEA